MSPTVRRQIDEVFDEIEQDGAWRALAYVLTYWLVFFGVVAVLLWAAARIGG